MFVPYRPDVTMHRWPIANAALILLTCVISIALFSSMQQWNHDHQADMAFEHGQFVMDIPANQADDLMDHFMLEPGHFELSQLVGNLLVHEGWAHLLGNMFFLFLFGCAVDARLGHALFLAVYFGAGIFESLVYLAFGPHIPCLGASGAIMGVMGAFFVLYPRNNISCYYWFWWDIDGTVDISAYWLLLAYFLLDIFGMIGGSGAVAHISHVAGFIFGMAVTIAMLKIGWIQPVENEENLLQALRMAPAVVEE